jgi:gluconokinase
MIMGVSGSGKTTVGRLIAKKLDWPFLDADDLHSNDTIAKMASGTPLNDADREPWLDKVALRISTAASGGENLIIACSALKNAYRRKLGVETLPIELVHLVAPHKTIRQRIEARAGHFFPAEILDSQYRILEPPSQAFVANATLTAESIATAVISRVLVP